MNPIKQVACIQPRNSPKIKHSVIFLLERTTKFMFVEPESCIVTKKNTLNHNRYHNLKQAKRNQLLLQASFDKTQPIS
jgi:hypothetical protein